jgi:enoyl-CoA hydratase
MQLTNLIFDKASIATVTVNRPAALNALDRRVLEELAQVLRDVRHDPAIRVLIVTGAGDRAFVAGADIAAMSQMSAVEGMELTRLGHRVMQTFEDLPIPVIAAVNGFALGGGLELALACDLIVASEKARFGQPEINLGLIPGFGGTQRLPHRIGHMRARELIMTGDMIDAKTALEWRLVNAVVAPDELIGAARKLGEKLASKPALALRQAKAAQESTQRPSWLILARHTERSNSRAQLREVCGDIACAAEAFALLHEIDNRHGRLRRQAVCRAPYIAIEHPIAQHGDAPSAHRFHHSRQARLRKFQRASHSRFSIS